MFSTEKVHDYHYVGKRGNAKYASKVILFVEINVFKYI